jgi:hypothetical protein
LQREFLLLVDLGDLVDHLVDREALKVLRVVVLLVDTMEDFRFLTGYPRDLLRREVVERKSDGSEERLC